MSALGVTMDFALVLVVIGAAVAFLTWRLIGERAAPPCHITAGKRPGAAAPEVVLGASLARGLERARSRNAQKYQK